MGFDFGVEEMYVNGFSEDTLKVWPKEGDKTALVDADALPYLVGYTSDITEYLEMKRYNKWDETDTWLGKKSQANFLLNQWVEKAGCDSAILYLTDGASNFRLEIGETKEYKGQRTSPKPPFFYEIKQWLVDEHGAVMSDHCEADDEISIEAWRRHSELDAELWSHAHKRFSDFVIISSDKDLKIIPGWHCPPNGDMEWIDKMGELRPKYKQKEIVNYEYWPLFSGRVVNPRLCYVAKQTRNGLALRKHAQVERSDDKWELDYQWFRGDKQQDMYVRGKNEGNGKFKRVDVGTKKTEYIHKLLGTGLSFFYSQLLTGDPTDNYPGLPGCGATRAFELLQSCRDELELYEVVKAAYKEKYKRDWYERLVEQGRLAFMQTERGELWTPPKLNDLSFRL